MCCQGCALTPREQEVARLLARRLTNKEIADKLVISDRTVESHVAHLFQKLEVHSRSELRRRMRHTERENNQ